MWKKEASDLLFCHRIPSPLSFKLGQCNQYASNITLPMWGQISTTTNTLHLWFQHSNEQLVIQFWMKTNDVSAKDTIWVSGQVLDRPKKLKQWAEPSHTDLFPYFLFLYVLVFARSHTGLSCNLTHFWVWFEKPITQPVISNLASHGDFEVLRRQVMILDAKPLRQPIYPLSKCW